MSSVVLPAPVPPLMSAFSRALHAVREEIEHRLGHRLQRHQIVGLQPLGRESANREQRTVHRERRDDRVDARSVRQARVHHRRAVVHAAADGRHDAVDDAHQVLVVLERRGHALQLAAALDEDVLVGVDQDVTDGRVVQQRLDRAEPEHVVQQLDEKHFALAEAERDVFFGEQLAEQRADFALSARAVGLRQRFEIQPVEQLLVDVRLELRDSRDAAAPPGPAPRALRAEAVTETVPERWNS